MAAKRTKRPATNTVHLRGRKDYARLSPAEQDTRHRAFEAVAEMRAKGLSLRAAAEFVGTTPDSVRRYANEALVKEGGRYYATVSDRAYQRMSVLSVEGLVDIDTRGSRVRSLVGRHWNAIRRFGVTGDVSVLAPFKGRRAGGVELASDPDLIEEYLRQGEVDIDDIYV